MHAFVRYNAIAEHGVRLLYHGVSMTEARITIGPDELDLDHTLTPGQSFRWKKDARGRWTSVVRRRVVRVRREGGEIICDIFPEGDARAFIEDYFRLDVNLPDLYRDFRRADARIAGAIERFKGLRVLRQEPEEALLSYVCSAANSVPRISAAIEIISKRHGERIAELDGRAYHAFPTAETLARADPEELAGVCSLGFRCPNLISVARELVNRPAEWLNRLREADYQTARAELLSIRGIGCKIADCVLLFSLDKDQAFPVDTHVRRIAVKHYLPEFKQKTLTPAVYQEIVDYFQAKFGAYAGWAQEYLFYDDLLRGRLSERDLSCSP